MKETYRRLRNWQDRSDFGTKTISTSGNLPLTGDATFTQDYTLHSYQVVPMGGGHTGSFKIEISNDNVNWSRIAEYSFSATTGAQLAYSDTWTFAYARPVVTGSAGNYLINERHLS